MPRKSSTVADRSNMFAKTSSTPETDQTEVSGDVPTIKRTFHLSQDVVILLEQMQFEQLRETGKKQPLSGIVEDAVRLRAERRKNESRDAAVAS